MANPEKWMLIEVLNYKPASKNHLLKEVRKRFGFSEFHTRKLLVALVAEGRVKFRLTASMTRIYYNNGQAPPVDNTVVVQATSSGTRSTQIESLEREKE